MSTSSKHHTDHTESKGESRSTDAAESSREQKDSSPGRIVHDSRGNAVWSWGQNNDPASCSTSQMLRKLDLALGGDRERRPLAARDHIIDGGSTVAGNAHDPHRPPRPALRRPSDVRPASTSTLEHP